MYIFVEGDYDVRFFECIIHKYHLYPKYTVLIIKYQQKRNSIIKNYIKKINARDNQDYIFVTDMDSTDYPCYTSRKQKRKTEYGVKNKKIIVVKEEIESWFMAGLSEDCPEDFRNINIIKNTDNFTKEDFEAIIPSRFKGSEIDFMLEILKCFSLEFAVNRNTSLDYFIKNFVYNH